MVDQPILFLGCDNVFRVIVWNHMLDEFQHRQYSLFYRMIKRHRFYSLSIEVFNIFCMSLSTSLSVFFFELIYLFIYRPWFAFILNYSYPKELRILIILNVPDERFSADSANSWWRNIIFCFAIFKVVIGWTEFFKKLTVHNWNLDCFYYYFFQSCSLDLFKTPCYTLSICLLAIN